MCVCDVNRVQWVTSSQGRLLTSVQMSALREWKEIMRTGEGRTGNKRVTAT